MLITEYSAEETLRQYIDQYGFFDESSAGKLSFVINSIAKIIAEIVISLKILEKMKSFHGRLKLNNVHIDKSLNVKLNDYGIYNEIYRGHRKTQPSELQSNKTVSLSSGECKISLIKT